MVKIITDSTCDLTKERMEELGVICVPLTVHIGDDIYLDGVNLSKTEFYEKLRTEKSFPTTAQPTRCSLPILPRIHWNGTKSIFWIHAPPAFLWGCWWKSLPREPMKAKQRQKSWQRWKVLLAVYASALVSKHWNT